MSGRPFAVLKFMTDVWAAGIDSGVIQSQGTGLGQLGVRIHRNERIADDEGMGGQNYRE